MFFAAPIDSPYARHDAIDLCSCGDAPFVSLGEGLRRITASRKRFVRPRHAERRDAGWRHLSLINLVSGGVGCSLLPGRVRDLFAHKIALVPLAGPTIRQTIGLSFLHRRANATRTCLRWQPCAG